MKTISNVTVNVLLCATLFLFACSEKEVFVQNLQQEEIAISEKSTFVSTKEAIELAEAFFNKQDGSSALKSSTNGQRKNVSVEEIKDDDAPLMYVVNYPDGGWIIVSATRNYEPILAYSDEGNFVLNEGIGPVIGWVEEMKEAIRLCEDLDDSQKSEIRAMWHVFDAEEYQLPPQSTLKSRDPAADAFYERIHQLRSIYIPLGWYTIMPLSSASDYLDSYDYSYLCGLANNFGSPLEYTIVVIKNNYASWNNGPLTTAEWGQTPPYNAQVCCPSGMPAGCGPIAMAQLMKYHRLNGLSVTYNGHTVNWSNLPNNTSYNILTSSVPYLIAAAKQASNTHYLPLVDAAWTLPGDLADGLRFFGYTVSRRSYSASGVTTEVLNNRPVIMLGFPNVLNPNGHYWICDGIQKTNSSNSYFFEFQNPYSYTYSTQGYASASYPWETKVYNTLKFRLNWGWKGVDNGWYSTPNSPNSSSSYTNYREDFYVSF